MLGLAGGFSGRFVLSTVVKVTGTSDAGKKIQSRGPTENSPMATNLMASPACAAFGGCHGGSLTALDDSPKRKIYFFAAFIFAHLAFWAARILAMPAALILRLVLGAILPGRFLPLIFAQRALAAREIFLLAATLILRFFRRALTVWLWGVVARIRTSLFCRVSILFLILAACFSC